MGPGPARLPLRLRRPARRLGDQALRGLTLKVQPEKRDREVIAYSTDERALLRSLGGHNDTGVIAPKLEGRPCWAGSRYLVVDHQGQAWPCYPARRYRQDSLGNLLDGSFLLRRRPASCRYEYCNCTVPQQRGMVHTGRAPCSPDASS